MFTKQNCSWAESQIDSFVGTPLGKIEEYSFALIWLIFFHKFWENTLSHSKNLGTCSTTTTLNNNRHHFNSFLVFFVYFVFQWFYSTAQNYQQSYFQYMSNSMLSFLRLRQKSCFMFVIGDWKDISIAQIIIIVGSIHLSHYYHIFRGCVPEMFVTSYSVTYCINGKTGNLFSLLLCSLWWVKISGYVLACRSYSFVCTVHHLIIINVQAYLKALSLQNACQIYFVECVSKIKHIFPLSTIQYVGLCVFSLPIPLVMF